MQETVQMKVGFGRKKVPHSFESRGIRSTICYDRALAGQRTVPFNKIHVRWFSYVHFAQFHETSSTGATCLFKING